MSPSWVTFLFEAANFLLLAAVLGWFFFRPVRDALERRRSQLEGEQRDAEAARLEAERALEDARSRRAELESALEELRERVEREAEAERERLMEAARDQMERERETLKGELMTQRRAQARALARDATFAARQIVVALLEAMKGPELERSLLDTACRELQKLRSSGPLAPIVIESVKTADETAIAALAEAAGVAIPDVTQRVNPEIVAGFRVLTARGLVDTSAAGLATQAERVLLSELEHESSSHG